MVLQLYIKELKINIFLNKIFLAKIGLVITTLLWGATFVITDEALKDANPFSFNSYRFLIAFLSTFLIVRNKIIYINKTEIWGAIICGIYLFLGYSLQNFGLFGEIDSGSTTPTKSAFITSFSVILVPLFLVFRGKQNISYRVWLSVGLALIGLFILLDPIQYGLNRGDISTFGCAVFFAVHIIAQDKYVNKDIDIFRFFLIQVGIASLLSFLFSFAFEFNQTIVWSNTLINALLINGILATTVAIMIMVWAQKIINPSQTAIFFSLEPVFAALFSWILIGEILGIYAWAGGFLVIFAIIISDN